MKTQHDTNESLSLYDNYKIGLKAKDTDKKFYFIFNVLFINSAKN